MKYFPNDSTAHSGRTIFAVKKTAIGTIPQINFRAGTVIPHHSNVNLSRAATFVLASQSVRIDLTLVGRPRIVISDVYDEQFRRMEASKALLAATEEGRTALREERVMDLEQVMSRLDDT